MLIPLLFSLGAGVFTFLGGMFALKFNDKKHLILAFSAGAVLGMCLFDLLPESMHLMGNNPTLIYVAIGFSIYMALNNWLPIVSHPENSCDNPSHGINMGAGALVLHSVLDGLGIGLAFKASPAIGMVVALAVLAHDFSDGINTVNMILRKDSRDIVKALAWLYRDAWAPLAGVVISMYLTIPDKMLGILLGIFAGFFLYIGASDLIPECHHEHSKFWNTILIVLGGAFMWGVVRIAG